MNIERGIMSAKSYCLLPLCLLPAVVWAQNETAQEATELQNIQVHAERIKSAAAFSAGRKASDVRIDGQVFKARSATLGNALSSELGVHSNPFGGGASAPIIRGQEGVRVKILQNGSDVIDMSSVSPDHVVAADTLLAQQVEILRGTSTLLYASASPAGVVNIADKRIPERLPEKAYEAEVALRADSASKEKAANAGITLGLGQHFALRLEGLARQSDNYRVPSIRLGDTLNYVPDTYNRSQVGTIGASWVGSQGYLGVSYSERRDRYGLPGHNHMLENCMGDVFHESQAGTHARRYLHPYPHLMEDADIQVFPHLHCGNEATDDTKPHSHDNVYGHDHDHSSAGPWVKMQSKRYDVRGEWQQPFAGMDKLKLSLAYADYYHDERADGKIYISPHDTSAVREQKIRDALAKKGKPDTIYRNKGLNIRLEASHTPWHGLNGVWGVQYQTQKSSAEVPIYGKALLSDVREISNRRPLVANTNRQFSIFGMEQYRFGNWIIEGGVRWEKQSLPIDYDEELLARYPSREKPNLSTDGGQALSYSGSLLWNITPEHRLSLTYSHNERLPSPMERYYHGRHLATNSFEYGNRKLQKERSNNLELGLMYDAGERWAYKASLYSNRFDNYIHNENINRFGNVFMRRYIQSKARFYGIEGELTFRPSERQQWTLFGDWVRGKLSNLPDVYGNKIYSKGYDCVDEDGDETQCFIGRDKLSRDDRNAARVPPARLGVRWKGQWSDKWSASLEYTRVFAQNKISKSFVTRDNEEPNDGEDAPRMHAVPIYEDATKGYHLLNAGVRYQGKLGAGGHYAVSLNANNLLNQKVYIHNSYLPYVPQMGRNFILGVEMKF